MKGPETVELWLEEDFGSRWEEFASAQEESGAGVPEIEVEEEAGREPLPLAVVEADLPPGLFGFTSRGSSRVVVNRNLYKVDKERTVRHEKTHHRFPKDELTIRYINGDPEVRNTLSFRADHPGFTGRRVSRSEGAAAYGGSSGKYGSSSNGYI